MDELGQRQYQYCRENVEYHLRQPASERRRDLENRKERKKAVGYKQGTALQGFNGRLGSLWRDSSHHGNNN